MFSCARQSISLDESSSRRRDYPVARRWKHLWKVGWREQLVVVVDVSMLAV